MNNVELLQVTFALYTHLTQKTVVLHLGRQFFMSAVFIFHLPTSLTSGNYRQKAG